MMLGGGCHQKTWPLWCKHWAAIEEFKAEDEFDQIMAWDWCLGPTI